MNLDEDKLKQLIPLNALSDENIRKLAVVTHVETVAAGKVIFNVGEAKEESIFLLSGSVEVEEVGKPVVTVSGGNPLANHALSNKKPRQAMALAVTEVSVIRIDDQMLDVMLTWDQSAGYVVEEISPQKAAQVEQSDWMTHMLQSNVFYRVPPANIHMIFSRFQSVPARAGQVIVRQDDEGDFYYVIKRGAAEVVRTTPGSDREIKLATLQVGDAFGEEALVTNSRRNASVKMISDGELMRLSKEDFQELLQAPVLDTVTGEEADIMVSQGAIWLDVRVESEFENDSIAGALNVPLYLLRHKSKKLSKEHTYIIYCDTGSRSSAAAFLMSELGFDTYVLEGGLNGYKRAKVA